MANDNPKKTPSADEIIEALALEMGVEEPVEETPTSEPKATKPKKKKKSTAKKAKPKDTAPSLEAEEEPGQEMQASSKPVSTKQPRARRRPSQPIPEGPLGRIGKSLAQIFSLEDKGDPDPNAFPDIDDEISLQTGNPVIHSLVRVILVLLITAVGLGATYQILPEDKRSDIVPLLRGEDIQIQRRARRAAEEAEARRVFLAQQPKYGRMSIASRPGYSLVRVEGQPVYVSHPVREGVLVEMRSPTSFEGVDVRTTQIIYINLPNFVEKRIEIPPFDDSSTLWFQDQDSGQYYLDLNEILQVLPESEVELTSRLTPTAGVPELVGSLTIQTDPPGAMVYYNNTLVTDSEGNVLLTPCTFSDYPRRVRETPDGTPIEEPERRPIVLTSRGVPIRVELEGYMPVMTGVHSYMYDCEPIIEDDRGRPLPENTPFWQRCNYNYDTGVISLLTPEEFAPPEEVAEPETTEDSETTD